MVIAIDNLLNIHDLTQVSIDNFMVLAKHKLKMKPQDKSFGLHVRSCGSQQQLGASFINTRLSLLF